MLNMKTGDIIHDNDPREVGRTLKIISMSETHVRARRIDKDGNFTTGPAGGHRIRKDRIYSDGKQRKSGFTLDNIESGDAAE